MYVCIMYLGTTIVSVVEGTYMYMNIGMYMAGRQDMKANCIYYLVCISHLINHESLVSHELYVLFSALVVTHVSCVGREREREREREEESNMCIYM